MASDLTKVLNTITKYNYNTCIHTQILMGYAIVNFN